MKPICYIVIVLIFANALTEECVDFGFEHEYFILGMIY